MCCNDNSVNELGLTDKNAAACACDHGSSEASHHTESAAPIQSEYLVSGMTCNHCVSSVTEELSALDSVDDVRIELNVGGASKVTVASQVALNADAVRAAVTEAGYELVSASE